MKAKSLKSKKQQKSEFDPDAVLARLLDLASPPPAEIPEGYKSSKEWAVIFGLSETRTQVLLRAGVDANEMERHKFRNDGQLTYYYRHIKAT